MSSVHPTVSPWSSTSVNHSGICSYRRAPAPAPGRASGPDGTQISLEPRQHSSDKGREVPHVIVERGGCEGLRSELDG